MNRIIIDTETTGLSSDNDELLQIAIIDEEGAVCFQKYIKPKYHESWEEAEKVNHITPEMVDGCQTIDAYIEELQVILDHAEEVIGYNTNFDLGFLKAAGLAIPQHLRVYDVMREFSYLYGEWKEKYGTYRFKSLSFCADHFGYDWNKSQAHDALADARATLFCYTKVKEQIRRIRQGQMKTAVVYFSRAGENYCNGGIKTIPVGNTEVAAEYVEELTGADMIPLIMETPYSTEYRKCVEQAKQDLLSTNLPKLIDLPESIAEYEVIFLGYPNYCGTIPMPVASFLENYDLNKKRIMPFCTNEGSGMGNSIEGIRAIVPDAVIGRGLSIIGSRISEAKPLIEEWLKEAKLLPETPLK